jgi:hypothetical protein
LFCVRKGEVIVTTPEGVQVGSFSNDYWFGAWESVAHAGARLKGKEFHNK